jgi:hypothetical protein
MDARSQFRGQKVKVDQGGFDNSNLPEGIYTGKIVQSKIEDVKRDEVMRPAWTRRIAIVGGDCDGRSVFPFKPLLDDASGLTQSAKDLRAILGDVVPGKVLANNEFELDLDKFMVQIEDLASRCTGEMVEIRVKNNKKLKDDGTPWQNIYINRGLGADAKGVEKNQTQAGTVAKPRRVVKK